MNRLVRASLLATLGLSGCAAPYVEPTSGELATVSVRNPTNFRLMLAFYPDNEKCVSPERIGEIEPMSERKVRFSAKRPATFSIQPTQLYIGGKEGAVYTTETCAMAITLVPKVDGLYDVDLSIDRRPIERDNRFYCFFQMSRKDTAGRIVSDQAMVFRKYHEPYPGTDGYCEPLSPEQRGKLGMK